MDLTIEYLAGFFDGEGSLGVYKTWSSDHPQARKQPRSTTRPRPYEFFLSVKVCGNHEEPVRAFSRFGGSVHHSIVRRVRLDNRPTHWWAWDARGTAALRALEALAPHLTIKRAQAELALTIPRGLSGHKLTEEQREQRRAIGEQLKAMKQEHLL